MSVGGVSSSATEVNGVPVVAKGANTEMNKTQFLEMLVTQLKYQDPMNPLDNTQMVEQQAMFAELEQMMNLNENFDTFVTAQEKLMTQMSSMFVTQQTVGFLGNTIDYPTDTVNVSEGEPTDLYYSLTEDAMVGFTVKNQAGNVVRNVKSELVRKGTGLSIDFDGKDNFGDALPDGAYKIAFDVKNLAGETLNGTGYARDVVQAVDFRSGVPALKVSSGEYVSVGMVMSVEEGGE
jgi:flagellar basal-body rod modification protein FlgD